MTLEASDDQGIHEVLATWEGYVSVVGAETFEAVLADDEGEIGAEFPLALLTDGDRPLVARGAFLTYRVGRSLSGEGVSEVRLVRRTWTAEEIADAKAEAARLHAAIVTD